MVDWKLKGCPRCGGDLFIDSDIEGWFEQCLQCAHWRLLPKAVPVVAERDREEAEHFLDVDWLRLDPPMAPAETDGDAAAEAAARERIAAAPAPRHDSADYM